MEQYSSSQDMAEGYPGDKDRSLIILLDVGIGLVEQFLLMVELVFSQRPAKRPLNLSLSGNGLRPAGEGYIFDNFVYVSNNTLDQYRRFFIANLHE